MDVVKLFGMAHIMKFDTQSLTNTVWAFARRVVLYVPLMSAMGTRSIPQSRNCGVQGLANTAWA